MEWRFKKLTRDDILHNAAHLEFFHNDALNSAVNALAREDVQNRLDARAHDERTVEIRYRLCGPIKLSHLNKWFHGLQPHLDAPQVRKELGSAPPLAEKIKWLVIEDFGTTGLEGDHLTYQDPEVGTEPRNDFFWFIRNVGRSGKTGGDRGRWGLGKIVYPASSQIRSFFAYSVRRSDKKRFLIGRSVLAVHNVDGHQHDAEGFFGRFEDRSHHYFATPAIDHATLDRFVGDFHLTRRPDEPGLSLVIPIPEEDIKPQSLILSVIEHWFWMILQDRLAVRVALPDRDEDIVIAKDTLENVIRDHLTETSRGNPQLLRKLQFARHVQEHDGGKLIALSECPPDKAPTWESPEDRFKCADSLATARKEFSEGRLIGFEVPVGVRKILEGTDQKGVFKVYLQKTESSLSAIETFLRDGLTISGQKYMRDPGVVALVIAGDMPNDPLGTLLGDAENPAHTKWESNGKHFRGRYQHGRSILSYVKRSAQHLCAILSRRLEEIDKDLLRDIFSLPVKTDSPPPASTNRSPGTKQGGLTQIQGKIDVRARKYYVECRRIDGGFCVHPHSHAERPPFAIQIRAAYEVVRGDPFKFHHPADFDFTNETGCTLRLKGLSVASRTPNCLVLHVDNPEFELRAMEFDRHRDLIVKVTPLHATADETLNSEKA